jgi:V/A-type H+-transporting ATPase subunit E
MSSGTDKIVSNILSESKIKSEEITQEANKKIESINEKGSKLAELEKNKILDDANKQSEMKYQQIISEAKMNARRLELGTREEIIEESFNKAIDELKVIASSSEPKYLDSLVKIIKEAAIEINGGDLIIHTKEEDVNKVKESIDDIASEIKSITGNDTKLDFGESINTIGGAILKTRNGEIEVNNTIESRILRFKKALRFEVANTLFK